MTSTTRQNHLFTMTHTHSDTHAHKNIKIQLLYSCDPSKSTKQKKNLSVANRKTNQTF